MRLRKLVKIKYSHLLLPFISISGTCAQEGMESPVQYASTLPPTSTHASRECVDVEEGDGISSQGMSSAQTSVGTITPQLGCSPAPEEHMPIVRLTGTYSPESSHSDETADACASLVKCDPLNRGSVTYANSPIKVFVYKGEGVMLNPVALWRSALGEVAAVFNVQPVTPDEILSGNLATEKCDLFIMPGGIATPFHEKLGDAGKEKIRGFANSGGKCLGVGAGAYFLSQQSQFRIPGRKDMVRKGVGLTQARSIGPFSPVEKTRFALRGTAFPITYVQDQYKTQSSAFCNGGCVFEGHTPASVIAKSTSGQAVVVKESDNIVLSGVHPEFSSSWIPFSSSFQQKDLTNTSRDLLRCILRNLSLI